MISNLAQFWLPTFTVPALAVAGVLAVSVPIAIHLLTRRQRRPAPWAAMRFVLEAFRRHRTRLRLEQWLLLALRCLIVLLAGAALAGPILHGCVALPGLPAAGRTVCVIFDNGLSSAARNDQGVRRFDRLVTTADRLLASLGPSDRIALVTTARPAEAVITPPSADPALARRRIAQLQPSPAAADLPQALRLARQAIESEEASAGALKYNVLLSDLSQGAVALDEPLPQSLSDLDGLATLVRSAPLPSASNVQIVALRPDRRIALPEQIGAPPTVVWNVELRRFDADLPAASTTLRLERPDAAPVIHTVRWQADQQTQSVPIDMPLDSYGPVAVRASIETAAQGNNALELDDMRHATVHVRRRVNLALLGRDDPIAQAADSRMPPHRWLAAALAPMRDTGDWPVHVQVLDPARVDDTALRNLDMVFVLAPELLDDDGYATLRRWLQAGGIVWLAPSPNAAPTLWPQQLTDQFQLSWSVAMEPVEHDPPLKPPPHQTVGEDLNRLRADLADLLRPVEIYRSVPIDAQSLSSDTDVLLSAADGRPWLISAAVPDGDGRVMLIATAWDSTWTNLPTKPLFVPLVHELVRSMLQHVQPTWAFEPGDQPVLRGPWTSSSRLTGPGSDELLLVHAGDDAAVRPIRQLLTPGTYHGESAQLVVNVRPQAGNTLAADPQQLDEWLAATGTWQILDADDPAAVLARTEAADVGWPLLWAVLVLLLAEAALARYASHASIAHRSPDATHLKSPA